MTDAPSPAEPSRLPHWAPAAALALLVALPMLPAFLPGQTVFYRDLGVAPGPILEEAFSAGEWLPLWTSSLGEGRPLLANPGNSLLAPVSVLYRLLPFELAFELFLLLHLVIAALGMRALARGMGAGESASWLAGAAFGLGGFLISSTNLAPTLAAAAFAPWVVLAGLRAVESPSAWRVACLALALAACALGGQPEPLVLTIVAASAWAFLATKGSLRGRVGRSLLVWGAGGVWALLISAPQILVAALHARVSVRSFGFTTEGVLYNSLHPERLPAFFFPLWGGHPLERLNGGFPQGLLEDTGTPYLLTLYLGLTVVLLALAAGLRSDAESTLSRLRPALAITALAGLVLATGRHVPGMSALVDAAPLLPPFRYPIKFAFLAHLATPLLAAAGFEAIRSRVPESRRRWLGLGLPLLVAWDLLLTHASFVPTIVKDQAWSPTPLAAELHQRAAARGVEPNQWRLYVHRLPSIWGPSLSNDRRGETELHRHQRRLLFPAMGLPQGIDYAFDPSFDLLDPITEFKLAHATHARPGPRQWRAVGLASALFVISPKPELETSSQGSLRRLGSLGSGHGLIEGYAWLYGNTAFRPRVRLDSSALLGDEVSIADVMTQLMKGDDPVAAAAGAATIEHEDHRSLRVRTRSETPATLVVSDTLTDGWSCELDGEPVPILPANAAFRAVELPAGDHLVEMHYRPPGLLAGTALASFGLFLVVGAFVRDRRE